MKTRLLSTWIAALFAVGTAVAVTACGDDDSGDNNNNNQTCEPGDPGATPHGRAIVVTSLYQGGGNLSVVDLDLMSGQADVVPAAEDSVARWFDHRIWVLGRFGADNLTIIDGDTFTLENQFSLGVGSNPQDIACTSTCNCYVSRFEVAGLAVTDPTAEPGMEIAGEVDLSVLADGDGIPEMAYMLLSGDLLFVALTMLDHNDPNMVPAGNGAVAVLDTTTDQLVDTDPHTDGVQAIALPYENPFSPVVAVPGDDAFVVSCVGDWGATSCGGLVQVDTETFEAEATDVTCTALGGTITDLTLDSNGCGFAVVMDANWQNAVIHFCLDGSDIWTCVDFGEYDGITDAALTSEGDLVVTDGSFTLPGIRILDPSDCTELTQDVIPTGYAPGYADPILLVP